MALPRRMALAFLALLLVLPLAALAIPSLRWRVLQRLPPGWRITATAWRFGVSVEDGVEIPMPDGVRLRATLYRPRGARGPLPTVLVRLPYHRLRWQKAFVPAIQFARHGYAVLVQDLRGTGDSGGELLPWKDAASDGVSTLDWIARQPWSNGRVGTFGCSALGETQFPLALRRHPAHRAMIASGAGGAVGSAAGRYGYFGVFEGGIFELATGFGWFAEHGAKDRHAPPARPFDLAAHLRQLPVTGLVEAVRPSPNGYKDYLTTPLDDPRWRDLGFVQERDVGGVPALLVNTWGDQTTGDTLALAEDWRRRDPSLATTQKVVIAPGDHCGHAAWDEGARPWGELVVEGGGRPYDDWYLRWFDRWLKEEGPGLEDLSPYSYFVVNENRWRSAGSWPPADAIPRSLHLSSVRGAATRQGDGKLGEAPPERAGFDEIVYDPRDPVPTRGGPVCCTGDPAERPGPIDQADVERRPDVLVYTSEPLPEDLTIAGPLRAHLTVSSDVPDTDLVARLVHVWPDGRSTNVQEGALRLRYRSGFTSPRMMEPGRRYPVTVDMRSIAYRFPRGHRLRLHVTSSSFPRLERNLNTGAPVNAAETRSQIAHTRVHHGGDAESWLELAVVP